MSRRVRLCQTYGDQTPASGIISDTPNRHISIANTQILTFVDESRVQVPLYSNGKLENLYVYLTQNSSTSDSTLVSRINGADGNLSITIPATTTGAFRDTSNYDLVNVGDLVNLRITKPGNNTITPLAFGIDFYSEQDTSIVGTVGLFSATSTSQTILNIHGYSNAGGTNITGRYLCDSNMLIKNLSTNVSTNTRDSNSRIDLIDNAPTTTATGLLVTIPAGNTGRFTNTSDVFTRQIGDRFFYRNQALTGTGQIQWDGMTCEIINEDSRVQYFTGRNSATTFTTNNQTIPIVGSIRTGFTTEAAAQTEINEKIFIKEMKFQVQTNNLGAGRTHTYTLRRNGVNTAASIILDSSSGTGIFTSTGLNIEVNPGDLLNYRLVIAGGTTGAILTRLFSLMAATETFSPDNNIY